MKRTPDRRTARNVTGNELPGRHNHGTCLLLLILLACFALLFYPVASEAEETFSLRSAPGRRDSLFTFLFGPTPSMPTERGLLVIHAFHDRNQNGTRDFGEESVRKGLSCLVDDREYPIPAFIPGLSLNGDFTIVCTGGEFRPTNPPPQIFIDHRGQIVRLDLPCAPFTP